MIEINGALVEKKLYIGDMAFGYIYGQIYDIQQLYVCLGL